MSPSLAGKWSEWVQMHFLGSQCYLLSRRIALYAGIDHEVDTRMVFKRALREGKILAFPRIIDPGKMIFCKVDDYGKMRANQYGIPEPAPEDPEIAMEDLDLVVVPGVAFDRRGYRIGFGGGYYDRILAGLKSEAVTVGFAYAFQVLKALPQNERDQQVKRLVTEQGFIRLDPSQLERKRNKSRTGLKIKRGKENE